MTDCCCGPGGPSKGIYCKDCPHPDVAHYKAKAAASASSDILDPAYIAKRKRELGLNADEPFPEAKDAPSDIEVNHDFFLYGAWTPFTIEDEQ